MHATIARGLAVGLLAATLAVAAHLLIPPTAAGAAEPWQGVVGSDALNVRGAPTTTAPKVDQLSQGQPVTVVGWVSGEEIETQNNTWAQLGEGRYVYSALIRKNRPEGPPPLPNDVAFQGKWIDVNLTQQVMTAYEGSTPVRVAVTSSGRPDYPTPAGTFTILRRVANETMDSSTLPWVRDSYRLEDVLHTQYFTDQGAAIHLAWWKSEDSFGIPTSHACLGLPLEEAEWFWNWAGLGVPVHIHQ